MGADSSGGPCASSSAEHPASSDCNKRLRLLDPIGRRWGGSTGPAQEQVEVAEHLDGQGLRAEGPTYTLVQKLFTTVIMVVAMLAVLGPPRLSGHELPLALRGLVHGALLVLLVGWWNTLIGRTSIDGQFIRQTGLWSREVPLHGIRNCQLVRVRHLDWLVAPRLQVRGGMFGVRTFYSADPAVLLAFERLARLG